MQTSKSCATCPSYLDPTDARDRFHRPIGAPMCGRHGFVLGYDGQAPEDHQQTLLAFAGDCNEHGIPLPAQPVSLRPRVSTISEDIIAQGPTNAIVNSCHGCKNCVKHDRVMSEWGWPLPLCKAKGTLIFNPTSECRACEWAAPGMPSTSLSDVELRPMFVPGFVQNAERAFEAAVNNGNLNLEPRTYPTDSEVAPEDAAEGIRAWRRITCPLGTGKEIFLPIFDPDFFPEDIRKKIPQTGDAHNPELYIDYSNLLWRFGVSTWQRDKTLLIQSLPGLGKTEFTYWLAWLMQLPWTRIFFTDSIEWDDIFGKMLFLDGETVWQDGRFTEAVSHPGILCEDEPNLAKSEIVSTLRTTTEKVKMLYLDAGISTQNGQKVTLERRVHKYCFPIWCANPAWDHRNIGTKELAAADVSRLAPAVLETPPPAIEKHIIKNTVMKLEGFDIPDRLLADLLKVSADIRELSKEGEFPGTWGIRENLDVAGNLAWYPFEEAFRMTALNYFEPETAKFIIESSISSIRE